MFRGFQSFIDFFSQNNYTHLLLKGKWGFEKETLRINPQGKLALTPHPKQFGDKTTHPYITTDFSESQLELITPPFNSIEKAYDYLEVIHRKVINNLDNELLWPFSMPGNLPDENTIPIARFNNTKEGKEKEIYRNGLALRYGKKMQMISGVHYNFSFGNDFWELLHKQSEKNIDKQTFINNSYFRLARNYLRYRWLLLYLFGASPIADNTYNQTILHKLNLYDACCPNRKLNSYIKNTTTLRMSPLGYVNEQQNKQKISCNNLEDYINDLKKLLNMKSPHFNKFGIFRDNQQIQLNDNILQLAAEYYCPIRFKQPDIGDETPLDALLSHGIDYIEIRTFDLDPFDKTGISLQQLYFVHVFMLYCLFENSPKFTSMEEEIIDQNIYKTSLKGRKPNLKLTSYSNTPITLQEWSKQLFVKLKNISQLLDKNSGNSKYSDSVDLQFQKILNPELIPSNQIIREMNKNNESFSQYGIRKAKEYTDYFRQYNHRNN